MKKSVWIMILLFILLATVVLGVKTEIFFFYGDGCPHCEKEKIFLNKMQNKYSELDVKSYETYFDANGKQLFEDMLKAHESEFQGVPTTFIGEKIIVGFDESMSPGMEKEIKNCLENGCESPSKKLSGTSKKLINQTSAELPAKQESKILGIGKIVFLLVVALTVLLTIFLIQASSKK